MQENMKNLWEQWKKLDVTAKTPYEAQAANDSDRYRREVNLQYSCMHSVGITALPP